MPGRSRRGSGAGAAILAVATVLVPAAAGAAQPAATAGAAVSAPAQSAPPPWARGNWQRYVLAPASRSMAPTAVYKVLPRSGTVTNAAGLVHPDGQPTVLTLPEGDQQSSPLVILDMGKETGGRVSVTITGTSSPAPALHACFSESTSYMALSSGQNDDETSYAPGCDTANIWNGYPGFPYTWDSDSHLIPVGPAAVPGTFTSTQLRGGFRYLTLFLSSPGSIDISKVRADVTAAPGQRDLRAYKGWFDSSSSLLNRLWYAGAYTVQLDTTMPDAAKGNISNNPADPCWPYQQGEADHADGVLPAADQTREVIFDGGKRDRTTFTGDMAVEGPVTELTTGDEPAIRNTLLTFARQALPDGFVSGVGLQCPNNSLYFSGSYDLWFVQDVYDYFLRSGDRAFLAQIYPAVTGAMRWAEPQVDSTGLLSFARYGGQGACGLYGYGSCDHLTYVNALYVRTLHDMATLANAMGDSAQAAGYTSQATALTATVNKQLWDRSVGAYRMSPEHPDIYPQDAGAMAILAGLATPAQASAELDYLQAHEWSTYGALTVPPGTPSSPQPAEYEPLPSAMEVAARFAAGDTPSAVALMRQFWGYMLDAPFGPQSTFWEKVNQQGMPAIAQFTSLAHGWASGPTISLTQDVAGITPTSPGYATWAITPHEAGLTWAEAGVPTPHGLLAVRWQLHGQAFQAWIKAPGATAGTISIPATSAQQVVRINGRLVWDGTSYEASPYATGAHATGGYVQLTGVRPGRYHITATPQH